MNRNETRRDFLANVSAAGLVGVAAAPPGFLARTAAAAAERPPATDGRILVLLQMGGGNDGLNTVVPVKDDDYYKARPALAIPKNQGLKLTDSLSLHPRMNGLKALFDQGLVSILQGVGYPNPDRSHFRSMDIWQSARPDAERFIDGWAGRALETAPARADGASSGLSLGFDRLPLAMTSRKLTIPNIQDVSEYRLDVGGGSPAAISERKKRMVEFAAGSAKTTDSDLDYLRATARTAYASADRLEQVIAADKDARPYPGGGIGRKLQTIARMVAGGLGPRLYFVSHDGFDTHSQQLGAHAALLGELSDGLKAFVDDLSRRKLMDRVLVVTFSEFGRRVKENASLGTDHGVAGPMFAISPHVKGGMVGKHPSLTDLTEGDLKHHTDFRSVYATMLDRWLGIDSKAVLGSGFRPTAFLKDGV
jgi:uncharacterized protein (DUF1501 family)